jgi:hypothetical protein
VASFSSSAFGQDTAFSSSAWDFGGGPPPPPPPTPTGGGTVGSGRTEYEEKRRPFDDVPLIVGLPALPIAPPPLAPVEIRTIIARSGAAQKFDAAAAEADELALLQMQAGVALTEMQVAAWREARRMALEEEEAIAVMLMAIGLQ